MNARDFPSDRGFEAAQGLGVEHPDHAAPSPDGATFTLGDLFAAIMRAKILVIAMSILGGLGGFVVAKQIMPHYSAEATLISDLSLAGIADSATRETTTMIDPSVTPTIVETIGSPVVIGRALLALMPELRDRLLDKSGVRQEIAQSSDPATTQALEQLLLQQYLSDNLEVTNSGRSYVVYVAYVSGDAELSAAVANAVANAYLDYRTELRRDSFSVALRSLEGEISTLKSELQTAERTAQTMREQVRLLAARSEALTGQKQDAAIAESAGLYARQREAEREAEATASVYERLLLNQREIQSRISTPELDVQMFAPAAIPLRPSGANIKPVLLVLGLAGGFCLGASIALVRARWMSGKQKRKAA
jgi:uncharacterized protein involved in exopolysaccharide biosynthesis